MKTMNPSTKFISLLFMTFVLAYFHHPILNISIFALCVVLILAAGVKGRNLLLGMIPILLCALGMFMTGLKYSTAGGDMPVKDATMMFATSAAWNGLILSSRVLVYAGIGYLFALTTDRVQMIRSFERQLKLPQMFAYGLLAAWGIFPQMVQEYKRTLLAFRARGIHVFPVSPSILKPMLVKAVRWSEELSIAMESKGFSGKDTRSTYEPVRVRTRDIIMCVICIIVFPVACFLFL